MIVVIMTGLGYAAIDRVETFESALSVWGDAARKLPEDATWGGAHIMNSVGVQLSKLGRNAEAKEYFLKAVAIDDCYVNAWINLSAVMTSLGEYNHALFSCEKAVSCIESDKVGKSREENPLVGIYINTGVVYEFMKMDDVALDYYQKAIDQNKRRKTQEVISAYYNRGRNHARNKRFDEALRDFEMAMSLVPEGELARKTQEMLDAYKAPKN